MPPPSDAATDGLTGLLVPAAWARTLADEEARIRRYHRPATIVLIEIEGLDRLTSMLGPSSVERIVPAVADTLRRGAREADHVARLATGRFGVLMPETDEVLAINYVERVRTRMRPVAGVRGGVPAAGHRLGELHRRRCPARCRSPGHGPDVRRARAARTPAERPRHQRRADGARSGPSSEGRPRGERSRGARSVAAEPDAASRCRAGVLPVVDDRHAVDQHVVDPVRERRGSS